MNLKIYDHTNNPPQVYKQIYGKDNVEFILLPMPRLEVESVADMKILFEIGALTPDMSLQLSHIMLGEDIDNKRRRIQLERGAQQQTKRGEDGLVMTPAEIQAAKGAGSGKKQWGDKGQDKDSARPSAGTKEGRQ